MLSLYSGFKILLQIMYNHEQYDRLYYKQRKHRKTIWYEADERDV